MAGNSDQMAAGTVALRTLSIMRWAGLLGAWLRKRVDQLGDLLGMLWLTLRQSAQLTNRNKRHVFWILFKRQLFNSGFKATYVNCALAVLISIGFTNLMLVWLTRLDRFAEIYTLVVLQELAPLISGIILIARSATAVTAETAYLKVSHELEVLQSQGVNSLFIFALPVFLAFPVSLLLMFIYFNSCAMIASWLYILSTTQHEMRLLTFVNAILANLTPIEYCVLIFKAMAGGMSIGLISLYSGWQVGDRFTDISRAISNSTTTLLLLFFALNIALSIIAY